MEIRRWYPRLVTATSTEVTGNSYSSLRGGRALYDDYTSSELRGKLVVSYETDRGTRVYTLCNSHADLYRLVKETPEVERRYHEITPQNSTQKPRFDIDIHRDDLPPGVELEAFGELVKDRVITAVASLLLERGITLDLRGDVGLYTSHGPLKRSFHVIIHGYSHPTSLEALAFYELVHQRLPGGSGRYVDRGVYSSNSSLRLLWSHKLNDVRLKRWQATYNYLGSRLETSLPQVPRDDDHLNLIVLGLSLITFTSGCQMLPPFALVKPRHNLVEAEMDTTTLEEAAQLLQTRFGVTFEVESTKGSLIALRRLQPSYCDVCQRLHQGDNPYMWVVGDILYFHCRRAPREQRQLLGRLSNPIPYREVREPVPTTTRPPTGPGVCPPVAPRSAVVPTTATGLPVLPVSLVLPPLPVLPPLSEVRRELPPSPRTTGPPGVDDKYEYGSTGVGSDDELYQINDCDPTRRERTPAPRSGGRPTFEDELRAREIEAAEIARQKREEKRKTTPAGKKPRNSKGPSTDYTSFQP